MSGLVLVTPPAVEPISLADAKLWLRLDVTDDDNIVNLLITTARRFVENHSRRSLINTVWKYTLDVFPPFQQSLYQLRHKAPWLPQSPQFLGAGAGIVRLPRAPVQSIGSITYVDGDGVTQTLAGTEYITDFSTEPARVSPAFGKVWPVTRYQIGAVAITFTAGYGAASTNVPAEFLTVMRFLIANYYERRGDEAAVAEAEKAAGQMLDQLGYGEYV